MKVLLFTHEQDIDGIGSVLLAKKAFKDLTYVPSKTFEIDEQVKKYIDNNKIYEYDKIFVTDLCIHEPLLTIINEDEKLKNKFIVLDHHKTEIKSAKYDFVNIILECEKGQTSGTYLFYEYLVKNEYLKRENIYEELVELTRQYDTWEWEKYNNQKARQLHLLFEQIGYEKYIEIMTKIIENNNEIIFSQNELEIINDWEETFKKESKNILENMVVYDIEIENRNYKVGYIYTPYKYRNDFSSILQKDNKNDIDLVGMFFPNMNVVSYRGVKKVDVSVVPTYFGGKGHKGAGTNPIDNEKFKEVLKIVNFK